MLPDYFVTLESLTVTVNGKVDRRALPLPEIETAVSEGDRPLTETEQSLAGGRSGLRCCGGVRWAFMTTSLSWGATRFWRCRYTQYREAAPAGIAPF